MKKILYLLLIFYINSNAQWVSVNSNSTNNLQDVILTDTSTGYIVGDNGTVLKTIDSGNNWSSVFTLNNTEWFISTSFINNQIGYILSPNNLYKTIDGGNSWLLLYSSSDVKNVVYFISENIGFIGTNNGILKTIDGGNNWINVQNTLHKIKSISFPSQDIGYFVGGSDSSDNIYKTINQGNNFDNYVLFMQSIKEKVYFINDNIGYVIGWYSPWIKKTIDGGLTWIDLFNSVNSGVGGMEINFIDEINGFYIDNSGGQSNLFKTTNSGQTWSSELNLNTSLTYGFSKLSTKFNKGFLIGENGLIYKKDNLFLNINEKKNSDNIKIYPNPATNEFKIATEKILNKIEIVDNCGRIVKTIIPNLQTTTINVSDLSTGIYSVILVCDGVAKDVKSLIVQ